MVAVDPDGERLKYSSSDIEYIQVRVAFINVYIMMVFNKEVSLQSLMLLPSYACTNMALISIVPQIKVYILLFPRNKTINCAYMV